MNKIFHYNFDKHYLPRWVVLLFDLIIISIIVYITTALLPSNFNSEILDSDYLIISGIAVISFLVSWLLIKPHLGIIRHFSINDIMRFTASCLLGSIFFGVLLFFNNLFIELTSKPIPYSLIVISFLVTTPGVILTRLIIYYRTIESSSNSVTHKEVLI